MHSTIKIKTIKLPWKTNHFNEGQLVFVEFMTGAQACKVRGKFRGKHKWVSVWFKWNDKNMHLVNIREIEISKNDYDAIMGSALGIQKSI